MTESMVRWIMIKNIILVIATCLSVYYISGWMIFMMMAYTTVEHKDKQDE
jgi:hypothetical protein